MDVFKVFCGDGFKLKKEKDRGESEEFFTKGSKKVVALNR